MAKAAAEITLTLMSRCPISVQERGRLALLDEGKPLLLVVFDGSILDPFVEPIEIKDDRLRGVWGDRIYRVLLKSANPKVKDEWRLAFAQG